MPFKWPPKKRGIKLTVVFPASNLKVLQDLRQRTEYLGMLARVLATFRVDNMVILRDRESSNEEVNFIRLILEYLLIPPYLRKRLVPLIPELRYAGLLPPLNIATHNPEGKSPSINELREGLVIESMGVKGKVFIGHKRPCFTHSTRELKVNERVMVRIVSIDPLRCELVEKDSVEEYVGFNVITSEEYELIDLCGKLGGLIVLTSKLGDDYVRIPLRKAFIKMIKESGGLILLFGNYAKDFDELVSPKVIEKLNPKFKLNFIPGQGTLSIRTIEALIAILSLINVDLESFK